MRNPLERMKIRPLQFRREDPNSNTHGMVRRAGRRPHQGWDLDATPGTPVFAISDGELSVGTSNSYGMNATLAFHHQGRRYYAFYAHLQSFAMRNGSIPEGTVIGHTGMTGNARGIPRREAHLHFEIRTAARPGRGLANRIDPGDLLGYGVYSSQAQGV